MGSDIVSNAVIEALTRGDESYMHGMTEDNVCKDIISNEKLEFTRPQVRISLACLLIEGTVISECIKDRTFYRLNPRKRGGAILDNDQSRFSVPC